MEGNKLIELASTYLPEDKVPLVKEAYEFAARAHQGQVRKSGEPYLEHPCNALTENFIVENGYVFTDHLARYRMPSIFNTPEITSFIVEHPVAEGPYGAKGVGEIVSIPTSPAITNAIFNAVGVRVKNLPVDQAAILSQIVSRSSVNNPASI